MARRYRTLLTPQEKIAEAKAAVARLEASMAACIENRVGETGRNHTEAIARWRETIARYEREIVDRAHYVRDPGEDAADRWNETHGDR
jgi:uncharacterized protein YukE